MKRFITYIAGFFTLLLGFTFCRQMDLDPCPSTGNIPINVVIHWDSIGDLSTLPSGMTVHWYPAKGENIIASNMNVYGGREWLYTDVYNAMCLDFNGNVNLAFRSNGTYEDFEVYNIRSTGTYNSFVPQLPGEVTVAEAYPYRLYIDSRKQTIDLEQPLSEDTVTVNFYPKDILREFSFLIYDVKGAEYITRNSGAISGMSGSYFPASGKLAASPSTILFSRVEAIKDGQNSPRWTDTEKALFAAKNPNWNSSDTLTGWTRDWITGKFVTFGPLNAKDHRFRLTVEAINTGNDYYYGAWENTVAGQIDSAMGKKGTPEEQLAWRQRNGGYDIILFNDNRLTVDRSNNTGDGGFLVGIGDWGDIVNVPMPGSTARTGALRAAINTYTTIPDFVINGIHSGGGMSPSLVFNEQYVYKPESGLIWDYAPKKFWPSSGEIDFYAYAPAGIKHLTKGLYNNGGNLNVPPIIGYSMPHKEREEPPPGTGERPSPLIVDDDQEDLLVAVQNRTSPQSNPVPINFRHAFSRVTVKAKTDKDYGNFNIKVTCVDLRNVYAAGKLELKPDGVGGSYSTGIPMEVGDHFRYNGNVTLWTDLDSLSNYRFRLISGAVVIEDQYTALLNSVDGIFVIPQAAGNAAVYVEYDIYSVLPTGGELYLDSRSKLQLLPVGFAFEIGRQYELQLTLDIP